MLILRRLLALVLVIVGLFGFDFSAAELNFDNAIISKKETTASITTVCSSAVTISIWHTTTILMWHT